VECRDYLCTLFIRIQAFQRIMDHFLTEIFTSRHTIKLRLGFQFWVIEKFYPFHNSIFSSGINRFVLLQGANGRPFSCRERCLRHYQKSSELAREAIGWNGGLAGTIVNHLTCEYPRAMPAHMH